jgi:hypothetical protein
MVSLLAPTVAQARQPGPSKKTSYSHEKQQFATNNAGKTQAGSKNRWQMLKQRWKDRFKRQQRKKQYSPSVTRKAGKHHTQPTRFLWHMRSKKKASSAHGRRRRVSHAHPRSRNRQRFHSRVYKRFRNFWQRRLKRLRKAWLHKRNQRQSQTMTGSERLVARNSPGERRRISRWRDRIRSVVTRIKARRTEGRRFRIFTGPRSPKDGSKLQALWQSMRSFGKRQAPQPRPRHQDPLAHQYQPQF